MPSVDLICLANSRKIGGHCVAGLDEKTGMWLRPISATAGGELSTAQCEVTGGGQVAPLDVVRIEITKPAPKPHQPEDSRLGPQQWTVVRKIASAGAYPLLKKYLVAGPELFGNTKDRVSYSPFLKNPAPSSLALIQPTSLTIVVTTSSSGTRQLRCGFVLAGQSYSLVLTDLAIEQATAQLSYGVHDRSVVGIKKADIPLLCVSLGEPLYGQYVTDACFKLVAAIIPVS